MRKLDMETLFESFLRMVRSPGGEPVPFDANATVRIETRLLDLGSRDHGTFPYLP